MNRRKRIIASLLMIIMVVTAIPYYSPIDKVEAVENTQVAPIQDDTVLVDNDFSSYPEYDEWLAMQIFGEGNYALESAVLSIDNGGLRIKYENVDEPSAQMLLVSNDAIQQSGVVIECDYTLNTNTLTDRYFAFASKPIVEKADVLTNDVWLAGIWGNGYRVSLRGSGNNNAWNQPGVASSSTTYSTQGTVYNLRLEVTPDEGILLSAKKADEQTFTELAHVTTEQMDDYTTVNFDTFRDGNVRLVAQKGSDTTLDNLKVTLGGTSNDNSMGIVLFEDDFNEGYGQEDYAEWLAEEIFGENNYAFGQGTRDATMYIENGALRIVGDNNTEPTDGRTQINRSQFLLSDNASISERGAVVEFNYTVNEGSNGYFALASKPLVEGNGNIDGNDIWISGIWPSGYRTSFRNAANTNDWYKPGYVSSDSDDVYTAKSTTYKIKIEALPQDAIRLSVMKPDETEYGNPLHNLSIGKIIKEVELTSELFNQCFDDNLRLIVGNDCDVTIDNLKITKAQASDVLFEDDFLGYISATDYSAQLASEIFGEGNHALGPALLSIDNGGLRIQYDVNSTPSAEMLLASDEAVQTKGVVIECDYTINANTDNSRYFAFASKPLVKSGDVLKVDAWLAGIWGNGSRVTLRGKAGNAWDAPGIVSSSTTYSAQNTAYNLRVEVTPDDGILLSAKKAEEQAFTELAHLTTEAMAEVTTVNFETFRDENVRLVVQPGCDVTIDNLKVYTADQTESSDTTRTYLFNNNFDSYDSYKSYSEVIAEQMVGEDNYRLGKGKTTTGDASISIEDGTLHIVGDDNTTNVNRTQLLLASDDRIAERGAIIECDYVFNAQNEAFSFVSKPIVTADAYYEQQTNWITCMRASGAYQASLRGLSNGWENPGRNIGDSAHTYSTVGTTYNLRIEVTPMGTLKMYAKLSTADEYTLLAYLTKAQIEAADTLDFLDCLDGNIRLCVWCKCDVTFDNMKVSLGPVSYDSNYDEQVTIQDIVRMKKAIADETVAIDSDVSDVDGNNSFDNDDITALRQYLTTGVEAFSYGTANYVDTYPCGNASEQYYYTFGEEDTETISGYIDSYIDDLRTNGYTMQQDNTIGSNRYVTLVGEKGLVHLTYLDYNKSLAVVTDTMENTVYKGTEQKYTSVTDTSLAVMSLNYSSEDRGDSETDANGESFVVTLRDGRYVIVDGGWGCDAQALYNYLNEHNKRTDGIKIAAWFLSHAHEDHYGAFAQFANTYSSQVSVEYVVAAEGASEMYSAGAYSNWLATKLSTYLDKFDARLIRPHAGQTLKFCDAEFRMLYTGENYINNTVYGGGSKLLTTENNASLVFQMIADGKQVLFTNDADKAVSQLLVDIYDTNLSSTIFQVNHHGHSGAFKEFVEKVNPTYSLWTTNQTTYEARTASNAWVTDLGGLIDNSNNAVADSQSHEGMQYLLTLMGDHKERCLVADGDVEIIKLDDLSITTYTPVFSEVTE